MAETPVKKPRKTSTGDTAAVKPEKAAAKKTGTSKTAAKPKAAAAPATTKSAAKATAPRTGSLAKKAPADADLRQRLIIETAYYLSEKRRSHCTEHDDWLFAEALVDSLAKAMKQP